jgi:RNA polymerase sigma factor (sigma-70 family)
MKDEEFESLVSQHYEHLYRFALSLSGRDSDARDLVQQTFLRWAQRGFQLRERSRAKTWLFTTLYREFLGQQRKANRYVHVDLESAGNELPSLAPETVSQMDGQSVMGALQELEENYRAPLTLFYLSQHSYQEIAEILAVPIGTVMSRLSRGKAKLRKLITESEAAPSKILPFTPNIATTQKPARRHD